jgi:hypothetical protein
MARRGSRHVRPVAILAVVCAMLALGGAYLLWRWRTAGPGDLIGPSTRPPGDDEPMAWSSRDDQSGRGTRPLPLVPAVAADPRLARLRRAAVSWRRAAGPRRVVVDQVCLVPDVPSFLEAIAAWDDRHFFPILIDEPSWTLPFLRAFRPARVVRHVARGDARSLSASRPDGSGSSADRLALWTAALRAVSRGWAPPSRPDQELEPGGAPPRNLGPTPPGVVLSSPGSPMLAGAVALAAGRYQPLVRLEPGLWEPDIWGEGKSIRYEDVLTLPQAWRFARYVEARVAAVAPRNDRLGDDCDFLTIAGDWPYRYDDRAEASPARGIQCLDDLIGRVLVGGPGAEGLNDSRRRWAFTGRLLGDPAASVARAMGALFLAPDDALMWDTYERGSSHAEYTVGPAVNLLARAGLIRHAIVHVVGQGADLANWHRIMDSSNRFGLIWLNSTGEKSSQFSIAGGPGRPADVPGGCPAAVVMIHSTSAGDPADPGTVAGRWLMQGAFVYFGSVHEPFLLGFRKPGLVADLAAEGVPLSAALRQGEAEPLGRPWRLIFLGDPLYRIPAAQPARGRSSAGEDRQSFKIEDSRSKGEDRTGRLDPEAWRELSPAYAGWPVREVAVTSGASAPGDAEPSADRRLQWCRDAAIVELAGGTPTDWRSALRRIRRDRLGPRLRPAYDELLIDALSQAGEWDELHSRLSRIPPAECRPRVWAALETAAVFRLARAAREPDRERGRARAREIQDEVMRLSWPSGWGFPAQFAARVAALERDEGRGAKGEENRTKPIPPGPRAAERVR